MERHVKERLIGAAVLVAAAVILIPEMLSGPRTHSGDLPAPVDGQAPLKTYTIDLSKSPATQAAASGAAVDERAPPAESSAMPPAAEPAPSKPVTQATPESDRAPSESVATSASAPQVAEKGAEKNTDSAASAPAPTPRASEPPAAVVKNEPKPAPAQRTPATTGSSAAPATASGRASGGWAVQVASFTTDATAQKMVKDLRAKGQDAFVMPFKTGSSTRYRVRIGPMADREAAAAALQRVKSLAPGAVVVAHP